MRVELDAHMHCPYYISGNLICLMHMQSMHCLTYSISFIFDLLLPETSMRDAESKREQAGLNQKEEEKLGEKRAAATLISCVYNN